MKTLKLTMNKQWFDMIKSGIKTEEYREIKQYWINRICQKYEPSVHEANRLSNVVICKSQFLDDEFSAYYDSVKERWCLYPSGKSIQVEEWRPIERL